jgi:uncharacterized protein YjiS (DUF1127 family)
MCWKNDRCYARDQDHDAWPKAPRSTCSVGEAWQTNVSRFLAQAVFWSRLLTRCASCCWQTQKERTELCRLDRRALQDIGLRPQDVEAIVRRPISVRVAAVKGQKRPNRCLLGLICYRPQSSQPASMHLLAAQFLHRFTIAGCVPSRPLQYAR